MVDLLWVQAITLVVLIMIGVLRWLYLFYFSSIKWSRTNCALKNHWFRSYFIFCLYFPRGFGDFLSYIHVNIDLSLSKTLWRVSDKFICCWIQFNYSSGQPAPESITDKIYGNTLSVSNLLFKYALIIWSYTLFLEMFDLLMCYPVGGWKVL